MFTSNKDLSKTNEKIELQKEKLNKSIDMKLQMAEQRRVKQFLKKKEEGSVKPKPKCTFGTGFYRPAPLKIPLNTWHSSAEIPNNFSFGSRHELNTSSGNIPGPGSYDHSYGSIGYRRKNDRKMIRDREPKFQVHKQVENRLNESKDAASFALPPDSMEELRKKSARSGTFGLRRNIKASRRENKVESPGPCYYETEHNTIQGQLRNLKGPLFTGRIDRSLDRISAELPGPDTYSPRKVHKNIPPAFSMGRRIEPSKIQRRLESELPGPGFYHVERPNTTGHFANSRSTRGHFADSKPNIPGPGRYNLRKERVTSGPQYTIGVRRYIGTAFDEEADAHKKPGPGAYFSLDLSQAKQSQPNKARSTFLSHRSTRPHSTASSTPGVGTYNIGVDDISHRITGLSFTKADRNSNKVQEEEAYFNQTPGPASYNLKSTIPQLQKFDQDMLDMKGRKISLDLETPRKQNFMDGGDASLPIQIQIL